MATQQKKSSVPADALAAARQRAEETRRQLEHQPGPTELLTSQELADAAPFYFVLRDYIRQLKEAREAAGLTLADVSARSGMAVESLSRLETGAQTNPTWKTLGVYAAAVGCRPLLTAGTLQPGSAKNHEKSHSQVNRLEKEITAVSVQESLTRSDRTSGVVSQHTLNKLSADANKFLESIQFPANLWLDPLNGGFGFPAIRVFDVCANPTNTATLNWKKECNEKPDLTAIIYAKISAEYADIVCLDDLEGKKLVKFAFRVFSDLCEAPLREMTPLDITERFVERFGLTISVGASSGKLFLEKEFPLPRIVFPGRPEGEIIHVDNPKNASFVISSAFKVDPPLIRIAFAFCINLTDYQDWINHH